MNDKPTILLVEDDLESANDYKEDIESMIDVYVIAVTPPVEVLALASQVNELDVSAVIIDELLQQRSDATYMGIDAFAHLTNAFPGMPVDIFTNYPHGSELRGRGLPVENLVRKRDFDTDQDFRESYLQGLAQRIRNYHRRQDDRSGSVSMPDTVTEEFVRRLARLHCEADDGIERIVWFRSCGEKEICLIEINRTALPVDTVEPFRFAPFPDVPFPLFIVDVRSTEWDMICRGDIHLPEGWDLQAVQTFERSELMLEN